MVYEVGYPIYFFVQLVFGALLASRVGGVWRRAVLLGGGQIDLD